MNLCWSAVGLMITCVFIDTPPFRQLWQYATYLSSLFATTMFVAFVLRTLPGHWWRRRFDCPIGKRFACGNQVSNVKPAMLATYYDNVIHAETSADLPT